MKNYTLHIIKHGLTKGNEEGRYIGSTDEPLSERGVLELDTLCEELRYPQVQVVYSSPLVRCVQTAEIIYPNTLIKTVNDIREYDFGIFENKSMEELKNTPEFKKWAEKAMLESPASGEKKADFDKRINSGLRWIISDMMSKGITSAAVVTHGGVIMSWLAKYGIPQKEPMYWAAKNGCGFTVTTSSYLWGSGEAIEMMDRLPVDFSQQFQSAGYELFDIDDEDSEDI